MGDAHGTHARRLAPVVASLAVAAHLAACAGTPVAPTKITASPGKGQTGGLVSKGGANVVAKGGENLVPNGGGNLVPNGGGNLVPNGGGNLVPNGGGNLVPNGGGNLVPNGGGNLVPNGGGNLVPNGGGMFGGPHAAFAAQLHDLAAIAHNRAVAQIVSNNGAKVVSNNTGGLLAKGGATLIGNNAGGLVGNNTGGLVGNNGGQAISNNGASFRLVQLAAPAFAVAPAAGEEAGPETKLGDGTFALPFFRADGTQRNVIVNAERRPLEEQLVSGVEEWPDGTLKSSHTERSLVYGNDQRKRGFLAYDERYDETGKIVSLTHAPSELVEPSSGLKIAIEALAFTVEPAAGTFEIAFEHLGAVETGTFTQVIRNVGGVLVGIDLADPLATQGGTSRVATTGGELLFERRTTIAGAEHQLVLTLRDGYALKLARTAITEPYRGTLELAGKAIGKATLTTGADAAVRYEVTFDDATPPLSIQIPDAAAAAN